MQINSEYKIKYRYFILENYKNNSSFLAWTQNGGNCETNYKD